MHLTYGAQPGTDLWPTDWLLFLHMNDRVLGLGLLKLQIGELFYQPELRGAFPGIKMRSHDMNKVQLKARAFKLHPLPVSWTKKKI